MPDEQTLRLPLSLVASGTVIVHADHVEGDPGIGLVREEHAGQIVAAVNEAPALHARIEELERELASTQNHLRAAEAAAGSSIMSSRPLCCYVKDMADRIEELTAERDEARAQTSVEVMARGQIARERDRAEGERDKALAEQARSGTLRLEADEARRRAEARVTELTALLRQCADVMHPSQRLHREITEALDAVTQAPAVWRCGSCGSQRWVAASLSGPVEHGGRAIRQCVPCGHYSNDAATQAPADDPTCPACGESEDHFDPERGSEGEWTCVAVQYGACRSFGPDPVVSRPCSSSLCMAEITARVSEEAYCAECAPADGGPNDA